MSKGKTNVVTESLNALEAVISQKPIEKNEIINLVQSNYKSIAFKENTASNEIILNPNEKNTNQVVKKKTSIASNSPFTKHFKNIIENVLDDTQKLVGIEEIEDNLYYVPEFVDFLMIRFMPYCFIWSGFVIRGLNNQNTRTRLANGAIENHFYSYKGMGHRHLRLLPAQNATKSYKVNIGKCKSL